MRLPYNTYRDLEVNQIAPGACTFPGLSEKTVNRFFVALSACLFAAPAFADLSAADRASIAGASEEWVETYNRNDWVALADLFLPDAVMMPPNHPAVVGRRAISAWEQSNENGFQIAFDVQAIDGTGDIAYVRGRSCVYIPLGRGEFGVDIGKYIEVRRRQSNGEWLIEADLFNSDLGAGADLADACPFKVDK